MFILLSIPVSSFLVPLLLLYKIFPFLSSPSLHFLPKDQLILLTRFQSIILLYTFSSPTGFCGAITSTRYLAEQKRWLQSYRLHPLFSSTIRKTSGFPHFLHTKVMVFVSSSLLYAPSLIKNIPVPFSLSPYPQTACTSQNLYLLNCKTLRTFHLCCQGRQICFLKALENVGTCFLERIANKKVSIRYCFNHSYE